MPQMELMKNVVEGARDVAIIWIETRSGQRFEMLVDAVDVGAVCDLPAWYVQPAGRTHYAIAHPARRHTTTIRCQRLLMRPRPGEVVDHINGDGLDNQRCNLRIVDAKQNALNRRDSPPRIIQARRGIVWDSFGQVWRLYAQVGAQRMEIGAFAALEDADAAVYRGTREAIRKLA